MIAHCPHCQASFRTPEEREGKQVRCPHCEEEFLASPIASSEKPEPAFDKSQLDLAAYARQKGLIPSIAMRLCALLMLLTIGYHVAGYNWAREQIPADNPDVRQFADELTMRLGVIVVLLVVGSLFFAAAGGAIRSLGSQNFVVIGLLLALSLACWSGYRIVRFAFYITSSRPAPPNELLYWADVALDLLGCFLFPVACLSAFAYVLNGRVQEACRLARSGQAKDGVAP